MAETDSKPGADPAAPPAPQAASSFEMWGVFDPDIGARASKVSS